MAGVPYRNFADLCVQRVREQGHAPLLTFYDDRSGERTELSYATFDNWASKAANLLAEELSVAAGDAVALGLDDHWAAVVVAAAAWKVGARVVPAAERPRARTALVREQDFPGPRDLVIGAGLGGRVTGAVDGIVFAEEVLAFGDDYDDPEVRLDDPAVVWDDRMHTQRDLLTVPDGLSAGDRLVATVRLDGAQALGAVLAGPLAAGASVVWCPALPDERVAQRAEQERAGLVLASGELRRR